MTGFVPFAIGYLIGSIPFGYLFARVAGLGDIRAIGSGNIGATNVLRTGRRDLAVLTLLADAGKGVAAVYAYPLIVGAAPDLLLGMAGGSGAFIGHLFPVWLGFRGGKGVATYIGVLTGLYWPAAAVFCGIWLVVAVLTRYSSLSAIAAAAVTPILIATVMPPMNAKFSQDSLLSSDYTFPLFVACLSAILILRHRSNIKNLMAGGESKIGQRQSPV